MHGTSGGWDFSWFVSKYPHFAAQYDIGQVHRKVPAKRTGEPPRTVTRGKKTVKRKMCPSMVVGVLNECLQGKQSTPYRNAEVNHDFHV